MFDGDCAKTDGIDSCIAQVFNRLRAEELAAHLMVRSPFLFHQQHISSGARQPQRCHSAREAASNDEIVDLVVRHRGAHLGFHRLTHRRAGL